MERRRHPGTAHWALIAASLTVISLGVFFGWVFPANQATANWTVAPENWETLRRNWEYGHAINAVLVACGTIATALAIVKRS